MHEAITRSRVGIDHSCIQAFALASAINCADVNIRVEEID